MRTQNRTVFFPAPRGPTVDEDRRRETDKRCLDRPRCPRSLFPFRPVTCQSPRRCLLLDQKTALPGTGTILLKVLPVGLPCAVRVQKSRSCNLVSMVLADPVLDPTKQLGLVGIASMSVLHALPARAQQCQLPWKRAEARGSACGAEGGRKHNIMPTCLECFRRTEARNGARAQKYFNRTELENGGTELNETHTEIPTYGGL
jgi:hypothetical protein